MCGSSLLVDLVEIKGKLSTFSQVVDCQTSWPAIPFSLGVNGLTHSAYISRGQLASGAANSCLGPVRGWDLLCLTWLVWPC